MIARATAIVLLAGGSMFARCRENPNDESSRYCQNAIDSLALPASRRADVCFACCAQGGSHGGRIVNNACTCSP